MTPHPLTRLDLTIGSAIAVAMGLAFAWLGGTPLLATFLPGLAVAWAVFLWLFLRQRPLPPGDRLYPLYFGVLAWQFIHFSEEYFTGFRVEFPRLFTAAPYSDTLFVGINMGSYFVFVLAFVAVFAAGRRFLLVPVLFFTVYGAIGNAISHSFWVIWQQGYFPGFVTAQLYWLLGPLLLARIAGCRRLALTVTAGFAAVLIAALSLTMHPT